MIREVYGKNGDKVVVMDVRDLMHGEYSVDVLTERGDGYQTVYTSTSLDKCIAKAESLKAGAIWSANGLPIPNDISVIEFSR